MLINLLQLHYTPLVFARFEELAVETLTLIGKPNHYWNRSVMSLYEVWFSLLKTHLWLTRKQHINQVPNDDRRAASLCLLNKLITQATQPLPRTGGNSLLHMIS